MSQWINEAIRQLALHASEWAFAFFAFGLFLLAIHGVRAFVAQRKVRSFSDQWGPETTLDDLFTAPWPRLLRKQKQALEHARQRRSGGLTDEAIDPPFRPLFTEIRQRGSFIKVIASTLIVLALLATFAGMFEATTNLAESVRTVEAAAAQPEAGADPGTQMERDYQKFRTNVTGALDAMSVAFGANLKGIVFAAFLTLLLPFVRWLQGRLYREIHAFIDLRLRPLVGSPLDSVGDRLADQLTRFNTESMTVIARELRLAAEQVADAMKAVSSQTDELANVLSDSVRTALGKFQQQIQDEESAKLDLLAENLDETSKQFALLVSAFSAESTRYEHLANLLGKMSDTVDGGLEKLEQVVLTSTDKLAATQEKAREHLEEASSLYADVGGRFAGELLEQTGKWREVGIELHQKHRDSIESLQSTFSLLDEKLAGAATGFDGMVGSLANAEQTLAHAAEQIATIEQRIEKTEAALSEMPEAVRMEMRNSLAAGLKKLESTLSDLPDVLAGALQRQADQAHDQRQALVRGQEELLQRLTAYLQNGTTQVGVQPPTGEPSDPAATPSRG